MSTACIPIHEDRADSIPRAEAALGQLVGTTRGGERLFSVLGTYMQLWNIESVVPDLRIILESTIELLELPEGPRAVQLRTAIDEATARVLAAPEAQGTLQQVRAQMAVLASDPRDATSADAFLRNISEVLRPPAQDFKPRLGMFGDSAAATLAGYAGPYWQSTAPTPRFTKGGGFVTLGCGILMSHDWCLTPEEWGARAQGATDLALIYTGYWETRCLTLDPSWDQCHHLGQQVFDDHVRSMLKARTDALLGAGVDMVVYAKIGFGVAIRADYEPYPERWERWYELLDEHAAANPQVRILDTLEFFAGRDDDAEIRPDGYHFKEPAPRVWFDLLEPILLDDVWATRFGTSAPENLHAVPVFSALWHDVTG